MILKKATVLIVDDDPDVLTAVKLLLKTEASEVITEKNPENLNWLLQRPTVVNLIIGARDEEQLKQNLGAIGWNLTTDQIKKLDAVSATDPIYPYWHQRQNLKLVPLPKFY